MKEQGEMMVGGPNLQCGGAIFPIVKRRLVELMEKLRSVNGLPYLKADNEGNN